MPFVTLALLGIEPTLNSPDTDPTVGEMARQYGLIYFLGGREGGTHNKSIFTYDPATQTSADTGIEVNDILDTSTFAASGNDFSPTTTAINNENGDADHAIDAADNWWGAADGPGPVGTGHGDTVSTNVDYSGFLTEPILGCPTLWISSPILLSPADGATVRGTRVHFRWEPPDDPDGPGSV